MSWPFSWPMTQMDWPSEPAESADDGLVLAEMPVAGQGREVLDQGARHSRRNAAGPGCRATWVFCHGVRLGVEVGQRLLGLRLQLGDLIEDGGRLAVSRDGAQFVDARVDVGDGGFETEVAAHPALKQKAASRRRGKLGAGESEVKALGGGAPGRRRPVAK